MPDLIIENIELFKVPPRWLFLKITTKSGILDLIKSAKYSTLKRTI